MICPGRIFQVLGALALASTIAVAQAASGGRAGTIAVRPSFFLFFYGEHGDLVGGLEHGYGSKPWYLGLQFLVSGYLFPQINRF